MPGSSPGSNLLIPVPDRAERAGPPLALTTSHGLHCLSDNGPEFSSSATSHGRGNLRRDERAVRVDDPTVADLVAAAADRDKGAWNALVVRFTPLVLSVTGRFRLTPEDAADVSQTLWLKLLQHIKSLREPAALPGWIVTTARNECLRMLNERQRVLAVDPLQQTSLGGSVVATDPAVNIAEDLTEELERTELHTVLLAALGELSDRDRQLLLLLLTDPPTSYADISTCMGMPVGGIGPNRARALERLRHTSTFAAYRRRHDRQ